jgi:hypothetical protein
MASATRLHLRQARTANRQLQRLSVTGQPQSEIHTNAPQATLTIIGGRFGDRRHALRL